MLVAGLHEQAHGGEKNRSGSGTMRVWAVLLALTVTIAVAASSPARAENVLRWVSTTEAVTFDPVAANFIPNHAQTHQVYEGLVDLNSRYEIEPSLATAWRLLDPLTWEFELRQGVAFHDGAPLTTDDVVFSLQRAASGASQFKEYVRQVASVEAIGNHTVRIRTAAPTLDLPMLLWQVFIMSKPWAERHGAVMPAPFDDAEVTYAERHANGTGPFRLESFEPGIGSVMIRNPNWWGLGQNPHNIDRIEHAGIADRMQGLAALQAGEIDFLHDPPLDQLHRIEGTPGLKVERTGEFRTLFLGMNQGSSELRSSEVKGVNPFKDRRVRQAVYQAIDIEAIHKEVMHGLSVPTGMIIPPGVNGWSEELDQRLPYDPAAARTMLAEAGYPNGFGVRLDCPEGRYVNDAAICRAVAAMLGRVGITVTVDAEPMRQHFPKITERRTDFYLLGWFATTFDAHNYFLSLIRSDAPFSATGYANPRIDGLIDMIGAEPSTYVRDTLIEQVWRTVRDDIVYVPLHRPVLVWVLRDRLELPIDPVDIPRFRLARLTGPAPH
jgi:peptide/nickel transport system substrate-binding protein